MVALHEITHLSVLMQWRREVIEHVFGRIPDARLLAANREYYRSHIADGTHIAYVARNEEGECGCGAVCFTDELPSPDNPTGRCAYLMNIYVRESHRNKGIAHIIVRKLIYESVMRGCGKIYLETTDAAKKLYTSLGFKDMPDMMKYYDSES